MDDDELADIAGRKPFYSQGSDAMFVCLTPAERDALVARARVVPEGYRVEWYEGDGMMEPPHPVLVEKR